MVKTEKNHPVGVEEATSTDESETRIDEFGVSVFASMGYKGLLPDALVETYNDFKRVKDRLHPGRLTPEGFAFVVLLSKLPR